MGSLQYFGKTKNILRIIHISSLWHNYASAMRRRRPGSELCHNSFGFYASHTYCFLFQKSALLGQMHGDTFCVSHFCPASNREGLHLLRIAKESNIKIMFPVTNDLVGMLLRIGYRIAGKTLATFRGVEVEKTLLVNN